MNNDLYVNEVLLGDNLQYLREIPTESITLVYIDPPFNKGRIYKRGAKEFVDIFSKEDITQEDLKFLQKDHSRCYAFIESINAFKQESNKYYLCFMLLRLLELHRVLKPTGSLYLHCDSKMSHYLKILLDYVFGDSNYRNEIIWRRNIGTPFKMALRYPQATDTILLYAKSKEFRFTSIPIKPFPENYKDKFTLNDHDGRGFYMWEKHYTSEVRIDFSKNKNKGNPKDWKLTESGVWRYKNFYNEIIAKKQGLSVDSLWLDIMPQTRNKKTTYPTQKPDKLLERIIESSTEIDDVVLDCFCGSGTTLVVARRLLRNYIGIDSNVDAVEIAKKRLNELKGLF